MKFRNGSIAFLRYRSIHFVNLSMSALGIFDSSSDSVMTMMGDLGFDNNSHS